MRREKKPNYPKIEDRGLAPARKDKKLTLSSTVSHFVTNIPSIPRPLLTPEAEEKSRNARSNLVSWSTASFPTSASPTKMILSGLFVETSYGENRKDVDEIGIARL